MIGALGIPDIEQVNTTLVVTPNRIVTFSGAVITSGGTVEMRNMITLLECSNVK